MKGSREQSPIPSPSTSGMNTPVSTPPRRFSNSHDSRRNSADRYSDRFIPSRLSTNLEDALDIMETHDASREQNTKNDVAHENQLIMNNLLRAERLDY